MVWRTSQKIGIAYATKLKVKSKTLCTVVVAKFDPPGNDEKSMLENIEEGSFDRSFCGMNYYSKNYNNLIFILYSVKYMHVN